jgi:hypothetical protein
MPWPSFSGATRPGCGASCRACRPLTPSIAIRRVVRRSCSCHPPSVPAHSSDRLPGQSPRPPRPPHRKFGCCRRSTEIRHEFHSRAAKARQSAANSAPSPRGRSPRPETIREFPTNFRFSGELPGLGTNFWELRDAPPCATSVHWCATCKPLRQRVLSPSRRFACRFRPKQCRIAAIPASFRARK